MDQLSVRRRTYILWPSWAARSVEPDRLAEAGFYYRGEGDEVCCYGCRQTFAGWKDGDVPLDVHRRRCPTCPVVVQLDRRKPPLRPPPSFSDGHVKPAVVKLAADVEVDCAVSASASTSKYSAAESCVDVERSSRSATATTANPSKPGKLRTQVGRIYLLIVRQTDKLREVGAERSLTSDSTQSRGPTGMHAACMQSACVRMHTHYAGYIIQLCWKLSM